MRCNANIQRSRPILFSFAGQQLDAFEGETVAAAVLASGCQVLRRTSRRSEPRGVLCGMGVCFECLMQIDGRPNVQACLTPVAEGMRVEIQDGPGSWEETT